MKSKFSNNGPPLCDGDTTSKDAAFSTLITVAPSSAKKVPTEGPARTVDASTTSNFENMKKYYCLAPFRT